MLRIVLALLLSSGATTVFAQDAQEVSAEIGGRLAIIGGCHDCHTVGYEAAGQIDPEAALRGSPVGFQGPWGTTYPANLRLVAADKTENEWVEYVKTLETRPPMPWYNLHHFTEGEARSLHQYIVSLGEPGEPAPAFVPPGETPKTMYLDFTPKSPGQ